MTNTDPRIEAVEKQISEADAAERVRLRQRLDALYRSVRAEKRGEIAESFDGIHTVQRAQGVGSIDQIVPPADLRPYLIDAVSRGIERMSH